MAAVMSILAAECLVSHKGKSAKRPKAGRARPGPRSNPERDSQAKNAATGTGAERVARRRPAQACRLARLSDPQAITSLAPVAKSR